MAARHAPAAKVGEQLLEALRRRDYVDIASCFSANAEMRAVVPPGVREDEGPDAIAARFRLWTEPLESYEVVDAAADAFADLLRVRWAIRGVDPEIGLCIFEQTAYAEVSDGHITKLRLACSGDRPLS
jgi:hypothetical protein